MWDPSKRPLEDGETLQYDSSAYSMFHSLSLDWPCLSFDVVRDNLGAQRTKARSNWLLRPTPQDSGTL